MLLVYLDDFDEDDVADVDDVGHFVHSLLAGAKLTLAPN